MSDYEFGTDVASVKVQRTADGKFIPYGDPIKVRAYHHLVDRSDDEEHPDIKKSWEARFKYTVDENRVAELKQVKDPDGSDFSSGWLGFGYLRCLPAVEEAVSNVHGVEDVVRAEETLGEHLEIGRDAEFNPE